MFLCSCEAIRPFFACQILNLPITVMTSKFPHTFKLIPYSHSSLLNLPPTSIPPPHCPVNSHASVVNNVFNSKISIETTADVCIVINKIYYYYSPSFETSCYKIKWPHQWSWNIFCWDKITQVLYGQTMMRWSIQPPWNYDKHSNHGSRLTKLS
jgi:hypothetical protein